VKAVEELKRSGIKSVKDEEWSIEDGLVLKEERIYVLEGALRVEVIQRYYDTACRRTWRKVENNGVGREELLVAGDDEGSSEVCGGVRSVPKAQEPSRGSGRQAYA